jgi:dolichyl-diphosphooligosaccharide--protein glycosyltransferase
MPPLYGTVSVFLVWALSRTLFDRRAALIAAGLLAVLPGHFLDRTTLGFVDHHALEALLALGVLLGFAHALLRARTRGAVAAGVALGLYLLAWGSGAFLVAVIGVWVVAQVALARSPDEFERVARLSATAALVALLLVMAFQNPAMHRYGSQLLALIGVIAASGGIVLIAATARTSSAAPKRAVLIALGTAAALSLAAVAVFAPGLLAQVAVDVARLAPDASRMGVLEARPLFLYSGRWDWMQPWTFFRTGFLVGIVALVPFAIRVWRRRASAESLILIFAVFTLVATVGQNRFGYYFVTACALLGGWLAMMLLDWAGVPHAGNREPTPQTRLPLARELAIGIVAGVMFAPNVAPRVLLAERSANYPDYWRETMQWLRRNTPAPFASRSGAGDEYYYDRYGTDAAPPDFSIMSWWDQGYWITQQARRVPVANPTQERAPIAARFYSATDESVALAIARSERSRYVVSDYELPFRRLADGTIMGRFQTIVDWTGQAHDPFYEIVYRRLDGQWMPVWIFHEPYYRSMAFRLSVLGAAASADADEATVVRLATRVDANGFRFREVIAEESHVTYEAARRRIESSLTDAVVVGLDPWQSPFPIEALTSFAEVHAARTAEQQPGEAPWVRVFEVR